DRGKIKLLDEMTKNQIAAGEVVERPASVIKELVENSLDSGASQIKIKILKEDGLSLQVSDNGCGMVAEDIGKSLLPHATSKISRTDDLLHLSTLGFRGEALASIAAISHLSIKSRVAGSVCGYWLDMNNGNASQLQECGMNYGTIVKVEDIFYNTPARKNFLRTASWEIGQISDFISKLALSHPQVAFILQTNNKVILQTFGNGDISHILLAILGKEAVKNMFKVESLENTMIYGLISNPQFSRANRHQYNFFINNRWVYSKELNATVDEVYSTLLPKRRYPLCALYFKIPPSEIDVNIHPSKLVIKLQNQEKITASLRLALENALLRKEKSTPKLIPLNEREKSPISDLGAINLEEIKRKNKPLGSLISKEKNSSSLDELWTGKEQNANYNKDKSRQRAILSPKNHQLFNSGKTSFSRQGNWEAEADNQYLHIVKDAADDLPPDSSADSNYDQEEEQAENQEQKVEENPREISFEQLKPLGQIHASYILAEGEDCLYIIDQHAAHERILYERFLAKADHKQEADIAFLAVPLTLELTYKEKTVLVDSILDFQKAGFILEYFGDNTFILRGLPAWYEGSDPEALIFALLAAKEQKKDFDFI
ncbi:MAG: DNA mismatch repair endonuclease MutL, partial [Clostridiales bacterium]